MAPNLNKKIRRKGSKIIRGRLFLSTLYFWLLSNKKAIYALIRTLNREKDESFLSDAKSCHSFILFGILSLSFWQALALRREGKIHCMIMESSVSSIQCEKMGELCNAVFLICLWTIKRPPVRAWNWSIVQTVLFSFFFSSVPTPLHSISFSSSSSPLPSSPPPTDTPPALH